LEIVGILFMLVVVTPMVGLAFGGLYWSRARDRERLAGAWQSYARGRGMSFGSPSGEWPNRTPPCVRWTEGGVHYRIEARGAEANVITRVVARPAVAAFGEILVTRPDGEAASTAGSEPLGARLVVRTHPAALAARVFTDDVKRAVLGFDLGSLSLIYRRGEVSLAWAGGEENDARLDEASAVVRRVVSALAAAYEPAAPDRPSTRLRIQPQD
jgi:hypothetical protein